MRGQTMLQVTPARFFRFPRKTRRQEPTPPALGCPARSGARKGENIMTEEIKNQPTAGEQAVAVPSIPQGHTGSARYGAERDERKPLVSWAALLEEAVPKPGYIHQAYSRFWSYSI